jgi:YVTN family beta-propeller protein
MATSNAWVTRKTGDSISEVNPVSLTIVRTITNASLLTPWFICISPNARTAYVSCQGSSSPSIVLVNLALGSIVAVIDLLPYITSTSFPSVAVLNSSGKTLYAYWTDADADDGGILVIDIATRAVVEVITFPDIMNPPTPFQGLALTPDESHLWATNAFPGSVYVIDTTTNTIVHTIDVDPELLPQPYSVVMSLDGSRAYVGVTLEDIGVHIYNTSTYAQVAVVGNVGFAGGMALTPNGRFLYGATEDPAQSPTIIDISFPEVSGSISDSEFVQVAITTDGKYMLGTTGSAVSVISIATNTVVGSIAVPDSPFSLACVPSSSAPPTRQKPRDDNLALGAPRQRVGKGQPSSTQNSYRQGFAGTYS